MNLKKIKMLKIVSNSILCNNLWMKIAFQGTLVELLFKSA